VENVENSLNGGESKRWGLYEKFYNISEWLKTIDQKECKHFYDNPFRLEKGTFVEPSFIEKSSELLADSSLHVSQVSEKKVDEAFLQRSSPSKFITHGPPVERQHQQQQRSVPIGVFAEKKFQIDPFENRKNALLKYRMPKRSEPRVVGQNFYETVDKQTFIDKKEYTQLLSVEKRFNLGGVGCSTMSYLPSRDKVNLATSSSTNNFTKLAKIDNNYGTSNQDSRGGNRKRLPLQGSTELKHNESLAILKQNVRKQKSLNDLILSRMELDMFIF
jgi:hypothetical protein